MRVNFNYEKILKIFITIISLLFISYFGSAIAIGVSNNEAEFYGMVNNDGYGHFDFTGYKMENERITKLIRDLKTVI